MSQTAKGAKSSEGKFFFNHSQDAFFNLRGHASKAHRHDSIDLYAMGFAFLRTYNRSISTNRYRVAIQILISTVACLKFFCIVEKNYETTA